jgi:2-polyprenyl-6-methoxyphenol hydroxylase-like FAD-dependent oxidoreductase
MGKQHIVIIGAGPSGLTLAALLQRNSIPFTLYEREVSSSARFQGGSLDLHPDSGQRAIFEAGLREQFDKHARYHDQDYKFADKYTKTWLFRQAPSDATGRPEIDRSQLRKILVDSVNPQSLKWGHHVTSIQPRGDGKFEVSFANHTSVVADLVVGADGTWSKIRPLLTDTRPVYTGLTVIDCKISNVDERFPEIGKFVARGTHFSLSDGKGIFIQRNGDGSIRVYPCMKVPERWVFENSFDWEDHEKIKEMLLRDFFADWDEHFKDIIRNMDPLMTPRPQYRMPLGLRYPTRKGLTLIGDALHVMTWFAGEGANLAMLDSLDLFHAIAEEPDLDAAVRRYEAKVEGRADITNKISQDLLELAMDDDSPKAYVEEMTKAMDEWFADGRLLENP